MADVYKLEWTHSRKTIQSGISKILHKEAFMDTVVVCRDGVLTQNKLTLGLILPDLQNVPVFDIPLEQTILMPDHSVVEIQTLINDMFPGGAMNNASYENKGNEIEVNMDDNNFEHFMESEPGMDTSPRTYGMRRGRGRPPLSNSQRMPPRFQCDFCSKGFYYKSMLSAHEKLHTGGTRETCEVCGAEYSTRQNLKNHMVKYHGANSFVPRKRGRPPIDPEKRINAFGSPSRPYRARGRPTYKHVGMPGERHGMPLPIGYSGGETSEFGSYNNSNDATENYHDSNDNINDVMNTESFLEQNLDDGDSDIAEQDDNVVIVDPTSEKVEPDGSNEYIEEKDEDDTKETDATATTSYDNYATRDAPIEQVDLEATPTEVPSNSSASNSNFKGYNHVSQMPVSQNLPSEPIEKEYQV